MWEKLKSFIADDAVFFSVLLVLVGVLSFGLGRQSVTESLFAKPVQQTAGITLFQATNTPEVPVLGSERVVTSKSGTKYHLLHCPGAAQIKESNKVYFDSIELAKAAGYTAAANCPGLQ